MLWIYFIVGVYVLWGGLSTWNQFRPGLRRRFRYVHLFLCLPQWRLFTGTRLPFRLMYRERADGGTPEPWVEAALHVEASPLNLVWFSPSVLLYTVPELSWIARNAPAMNPEAVQATGHYRLLRNFVARLPGRTGGERQFMIARSTPAEQPEEVLFVSPFEPI